VLRGDVFRHVDVFLSRFHVNRGTITCRIVHQGARLNFYFVIGDIFASREHTAYLDIKNKKLKIFSKYELF